MGIFKRKNETRISAPATRARTGRRFGVLDDYVPLGAPQIRLYRALREAIPVIDAAIFKIVRLTGGFEAKCGDKTAQSILDDFIREVPVGGDRRGLDAFISTYFEQLLTCGTAIGEIVVDSYGTPAGLFNAPIDDIELKRNKNGFDIDVFVKDGFESREIERPELCLLSVLNPAPGALMGNSILKGLPFVSSILFKIFESVGANWERMGNLRFAVTYNPKNDAADRVYAKDRATQIAKEWGEAMQSGSEVKDFVAVGDVKIQVIGADAQILDCETPARLALEQIVAKTGLPPFMLGLSWSSTERMSSQQADALTSELEAYRRILTPVIRKICVSFLRAAGRAGGVEIIWDDITLQDEVELGKAALYRARAQKITRGE